jgi:AGZA family xanthine/uracil permease-like MFS transporter
VESTAGVADGARTGLASVVTGLLFVLALFFTPLISLVPSEAATPALVIVGCLLIMQVKDLDLSDFALVVPAFLTIVLMPFTYSITNGIGAGFISYPILQAARGRAREVHPLMWVIAVLFVVYFALAPIEDLLGIS